MGIGYEGVGWDGEDAVGAFEGDWRYGAGKLVGSLILRMDWLDEFVLIVLFVDSDWMDKMWINFMGMVY
jgi:hypothetical protein